MEQYKVHFDSMEWEGPADGVKIKAYEIKCYMRNLRLNNLFNGGN